MANKSVSEVYNTQVELVESGYEGHFKTASLDTWIVPSEHNGGLETLQKAAKLLKNSDIPVAFPTETVYGLGADATRSSAVKGIYKAKGRPSDNPLIIHISDLNMLRDLLSSTGNHSQESIPVIYGPLIERFWPGPLTILLPNPPNSKLAPEVTAGLQTFGARMPSSPLALSLIKLAGVPIAAPSANASTKPSPTTANHVLHDLKGRIELILDGGACDVGVESTVVDGLCHPPVVLRPGGVSTELIRECKGWEDVKIGYQDAPQNGESKPRAPGMKYKHYSPKAKVVLVEGEADATEEDAETFYRRVTNQVASNDHGKANVGIVATRHWDTWGGWNKCGWARVETSRKPSDSTNGLSLHENVQEGSIQACTDNGENLDIARILSISLGPDTKSVAHGLFSALRDLDELNVDVIYVEGIREIEGEGDIAAAVMNRLRKAATVVKTR